MSNPSQAHGEEPLDPKLEALAARVRRFGLVSVGILFLGIFAVFGAVLYKAMKPGSSRPTLSQEEIVALVAPAAPGQAITSLTISGTTLAVAMAPLGDAPARVIILDLERLAVRATLTLAPAN